MMGTAAAPTATQIGDTFDVANWSAAAPKAAPSATFNADASGDLYNHT
jgi:hypothetical protein